MLAWLKIEVIVFSHLEVGLASMCINCAYFIVAYYSQPGPRGKGTHHKPSQNTEGPQATQQQQAASSKKVLFAQRTESDGLIDTVVNENTPLPDNNMDTRQTTFVSIDEEGPLDVYMHYSVLKSHVTFI